MGAQNHQVAAYDLNERYLIKYSKRNWSKQKPKLLYMVFKNRFALLLFALAHFTYSVGLHSFCILMGFSCIFFAATAAACAYTCVNPTHASRHCLTHLICISFSHSPISLVSSQYRSNRPSSRKWPPRRIRATLTSSSLRNQCSSRRPRVPRRSRAKCPISSRSRMAREVYWARRWLPKRHRWRVGWVRDWNDWGIRGRLNVSGLNADHIETVKSVRFKPEKASVASRMSTGLEWYGDVRGAWNYIRTRIWIKVRMSNPKEFGTGVIGKYAGW